MLTRGEASNVRFFTSCSTVATALLIAGLGACTPTLIPPASNDDPFEPDDFGVSIVEEISASLPSEDLSVRALEGSQSAGQGVLFSLTSDEGSEIIVRGQRIDDALQLDAVEVLDANGDVVMRQELFNDGSTRITAITGDSMMVEPLSDGVRVTFVTYATTPPTTLVADVVNEDVTAIDSLVVFGDEPNDDYGFRNINRYATLEKPRVLARMGATVGKQPLRIAFSDKEQLRSAILGEGKPGDTTCDRVTEFITVAVDAGCDVKGLLTSELPARVVSALCTAWLRALEFAKGDTDTGIRVVASVRSGMSVGCQLLQKGVAIGGKVDPAGLACTVFQVLDDTSQAGTGETLGKQVCDILESDEDRDGVINESDRCPDTPRGSDVDAEGCRECERDRDEDGVPDCRDLCPLEWDDLNRDTDGDGVGNFCDDCPDTPLGAPVDERGCAGGLEDDDNDTIPNSEDLCPHQDNRGDNGDRDGDGVGDPCDNCPDTPNPGPIQPDADQNGVGDACDGAVTIVFEDLSSLPPGASIQITGDKQRPTISWSGVQLFQVLATMIQDFNEPIVIWSFTVVKTQDPLDTIDFGTEYRGVVSPLQFGTEPTLLDSDAELIGGSSFPSPALIPGTTYTLGLAFIEPGDATQFRQATIVFQANP